MYYDVGDSEALLQAVRIKIEFLAPRVVQAKFREIAKTITKPRFSIFLAISRTPKKMSEPGVMIDMYVSICCGLKYSRSINYE
ncbi:MULTISPECIES: hypothetical protein [Aphanizomenonaceae]|jgi:hypothetical protein|uniref:Uncharacterized protein n=3 Tax=Aphanizomenonaceae TaxID=1892259 RepID=A0ABY5M2S9_9CYAN|nr:MULTISPECIES: hypothetical protein [Aphanizomenonaceae]MDK2411471.1 hypothetical protein [Aphanizomenon sp. 202]MDK2461366.1 hypothetical protein [Aphanizomenon sp. PH219]QSV71253.1 MAG: hypothetical protein HEQ20_11380 [Aphanizomenon flos-aquae KM1D3_PB]MBE9256992.1 hypothetical protein [Dolichospermum sp. LEGE 00246]MTJ28506.1 hypothetical protein [Aphanizomenon sp. UHCC 0183]